MHAQRLPLRPVRIDDAFFARRSLALGAQGDGVVELVPAATTKVFAVPASRTEHVPTFLVAERGVPSAEDVALRT